MVSLGYLVDPSNPDKEVIKKNETEYHTDKKGRQIEKNMQTYQVKVNDQYITVPPLPGYGIHTLLVDL